MIPVDIVITYCKEEALYPDYAIYKKQEIEEKIQPSSNIQAFGSERMRDWDNLQYWFRGVEQNCPWVNKIFFIIANEKHIPKWLNRSSPKLRIVFHDEFIPRGFLPTYNIRIIEAFEHRIKDLSEHFIYCDDDFFFLNPIKQEQFFDISGTPQSDLTLKNFKSPLSINTFNKNIQNTYDFCINKLGFKLGTWFKINHLPEPRLKSWEKRIFDENNKDIIESFANSKFRHEKNLLTILLYINSLKVKLIENNTTSSNTLYSKSLFENISTKTDFSKFNDAEMACFNDSEKCDNFTEVKKRLNNFLHKKFPNKSSFEKEVDMKDKPVIICAIAKNEHLYINDWVKYHIKLGFDHIFVFDNDDLGSDFIGKYVDESFRDKVSFIDVRGIKKQRFQEECYDKFYHENLDYFSWCAFIDIDEYIVLKDWNNIKEMVFDKRFDSYKSIKLHWHLYGDDECIKRDLSIPVYEFFKNRVPAENCSKEFWWHGKQITKGGFPSADIHNHFCYVEGNINSQVTADGLLCIEHNKAQDILGNFSEKAYINHYMTKTLDEFLNQKYARSDAMFERRTLSCKYYWQLNKETPEKIAYIDTWLKKHEKPKNTVVIKRTYSGF